MVADTTKSIKNATDKELSALLWRIRSERDALRIMRDMKLKSISNPKGPFPSYSTAESFSTETVVYNGKSIKGMTDLELSEFLTRLEKENQLATVILDIKEMNVPRINSDGSYLESQTYDGLNLNAPVESLYHKRIDKTLEHFGIPGMHWGIRRGSSSKSTNVSDHMQSRLLKKKGIKKLSTAELRTLNDRLQQEKTYKNLNPTIMQKGKQIGTAILTGTAAVTTLYKFAHSPVGKALGNKMVGVIAKIARGGV